MTASGSPDAAAPLHVHIDDFEYDPDPVIVRPGDAVEWHNHDSVPHDATADNGDWASAVLGQGESDTLVFEQSGTWTYHCSIHPTSMEGTLHVNLPPEVQTTAPGDGSTVTGLVTIEGTAVDPDGSVEEVEIRFNDGDWSPVTGTDSWSYEWDTLLELNGPHLVEVRAFDGLEHSEIASLQLIVDNPLFVDLQIGEDDIEADAPFVLDVLGKEIRVTVHNKGNMVAAAFTLDLEYAHDGEVHSIGSRTVEGLGAFSEHTVTFEWDTLGKLGDFQVTAAADRAGESGNVDPENSEATATVAVLVSGVEGIDLFDL